MTPAVSVGQMLCYLLYLLTPCILHKLLQLQQTLQNIQEDPDEPTPADKGDIQMEYSSDELHSPSKRAVTVNYLQELRSGHVPSGNPEYSVIWHLPSPM